MTDGAIDARLGQSRGGFLRVAAGTGAVLAGGFVFGEDLAVSEAAPSAAQDRRIFQFALLLEQVQAAFYAEALQRGALMIAWGPARIRPGGRRT